MYGNTGDRYVIIKELSISGLRLNEIGKTVFLSREEAEMEGKNG